MGMPTTRAFELEDEVTGLDLVDEISKPPVTVGASHLHLTYSRHGTPHAVLTRNRVPITPNDLEPEI